MEDIPETVQWVLDFLNIKIKPWHPNLYRFPYEHRKLNRPPLPQDLSSLVIEHNIIVDKVTGYEWQIIKKKPTVNISKIEEELKKLRERRKKLEEHPELIDYYEDMVKKRGKIVPKQNNSEEIRKLDFNKDIKFDGINTALSLKDFKEFFLKTGIPPKRGDELITEDGRPLSSLNPEINPPNTFEEKYNLPFEKRLYIVLSEVRYELSRILSNLVWNTKTYNNEPAACEVLQSYMETIIERYLQCWKEANLPAEDGKIYRGRYSIVIDCMHYQKPFPHYGMIPHPLYACIMDFGINHKELHSRLRQCKQCATFWIVKAGEKRGRPKIFCSEECENKSNSPSRAKDSESHQKSREVKRKQVRTKIIKWLTENHYQQISHGSFRFTSKQEAEKIYNDLSGKEKTSIKDFNKNWAKPKGYEMKISRE